MAKTTLGRGLSSLIPHKNSPLSSHPQVNKKNILDGDRILKLSVSRIKTNPLQPRTKFAEEELQNLADSIKEYGVIQPLIVSKSVDGYELIAGERRLRAAKLAGLQEVPAVIKELTNQEQKKLEIALIENIQRENLDPVEEARAYKKLIEDYNLTQEKLAKRVGKSRPVVANMLRILNLPPVIQKAIMDGKISKTHARVLAGLATEEEKMILFKRIVSGGVTTSDAEREVKKVNVKTHQRRTSRNPEIQEKEKRLRETLNTRVDIKKRGQGGAIIIEYYSEEELNAIINKIA